VSVTGTGDIYSGSFSIDVVAEEVLRPPGLAFMLYNAST